MRWSTARPHGLAECPAEGKREPVPPEHLLQGSTIYDGTFLVLTEPPLRHHSAELLLCLKTLSVLSSDVSSPTSALTHVLRILTPTLSFPLSSLEPYPQPALASASCQGQGRKEGRVDTEQHFHGGEIFRTYPPTHPKPVLNMEEGPCRSLQKYFRKLHQPLLSMMLALPMAVS